MHYMCTAFDGWQGAERSGKADLCLENVLHCLAQAAEAEEAKLSQIKEQNMERNS